MEEITEFVLLVLFAFLLVSLLVMLIECVIKCRRNHEPILPKYSPLRTSDVGTSQGTDCILDFEDLNKVSFFDLCFPFSNTKYATSLTLLPSDMKRKFQGRCFQDASSSCLSKISEEESSDYLDSRIENSMACPISTGFIPRGCGANKSQPTNQPISAGGAQDLQTTTSDSVYQTAIDICPSSITPYAPSDTPTSSGGLQNQKNFAIEESQAVKCNHYDIREKSDESECETPPSTPRSWIGDSSLNTSPRPYLSLENSKRNQELHLIQDYSYSGLCLQMLTDPNPQVRQHIVDNIAACEETIIPVTKRFLNDKNSSVRNSALLHICHRISPRSYTTLDRVQILNNCFNDSADIVRRNAEEKLIPMWFRAYGDKLCVFFKNLRLGNHCLDKLPFSKSLIYRLFKLVKISQVLEEIDFNPETALPKCLTAEKIFIWRNFYEMACQREMLKKFVPEPDVLIQFIIKCFKEWMKDDAFDKACAYNELISFTMDVIVILGKEKCEKLVPLAMDIMGNPFTPREVIPYSVTFYCEHTAKETKEIHNDLLETVNTLMKFVKLSEGEGKKKLTLKCLDIFCETLAQDNISASVELMAVKDELVLTNLDSDDLDIKADALRALSLYCKLDLVEARQFWPLIEKTFYDSPYTLQLGIIMEGAFDILIYYGRRIFGDQCEERSIKEFEETLEKIFTHVEKNEVDLKIVLGGMFKLYFKKRTYSPILMARLIMIMFHPDERIRSHKDDIVNFLEHYGKSRSEAECLTKSFLTIINILFSTDENNPYHKVNIKRAVLQLLEFAKLYEENKNVGVEEKFKELLPVKLTKKFLKRSSRMSVLDLHDICDNNLPKNKDALIKLKANVKLILESHESTVLQEKNSFTKKSIKFFTVYMKKIQTALDTAPDEIVDSSQRLNQGCKTCANCAKLRQNAHLAPCCCKYRGPPNDIAGPKYR